MGRRERGEQRAGRRQRVEEGRGCSEEVELLRKSAIDEHEVAGGFGGRDVLRRAPLGEACDAAENAAKATRRQVGGAHLTLGAAHVSDIPAEGSTAHLDVDACRRESAFAPGRENPGGRLALVQEAEQAGWARAPLAVSCVPLGEELDCACPVKFAEAGPDLSPVVRPLLPPPPEALDGRRALPGATLLEAGCWRESHDLGEHAPRLPVTRLAIALAPSVSGDRLRGHRVVEHGPCQPLDVTGAAPHPDDEERRTLCVVHWQRGEKTRAAPPRGAGARQGRSVVITAAG